MRLPLILCIGLVIGGLTGLTGCAGYKLGPVNGLQAGEKSVQVVPFKNDTLEPFLTDSVTTELRRRVQEDGTYRLATGDDADIVLSGIITRYHRVAVTIDSQDALTPTRYRISITAAVTARSRSTGEVIFAQNVTGQTMMWVGSDLVSAERQNLPLAAADLAKNAISLLTEGKWW